MKQIFNFLNYIHSKNYVHRNLKPESIMFIPNTNIAKIINVSLMKSCKPGELLTEKIGFSPVFPPEYLRGFYSQSFDIWSAGVLLYLLLFQKHPFECETQELTTSKIKYNTLFSLSISKNEFISGKSLNVSVECYDFL